MNRSLHIKIILILVVFIISVMSIVGTIMLNSVFGFYSDRFNEQMEAAFSEDMMVRLDDLVSREGYPEAIKDYLQQLRMGQLGIDAYRNFYILDAGGSYLAGSNKELGDKLIKTSNMLRAMKGEIGTSQVLGADYMDYARPLMSADGDIACIIYIKDSQEELRDFSWMLLTIILQSILLGLVIAIVLSYFLAKAITSPIQSLTRGAARLADGKFNQRIDVHSTDEIGTLATKFNDMARIIKNTLDEVSGEREKLSTIFLYLDDGVLAFAADGALLHINPLAREILGGGFGDGNFVDFINYLEINVDEQAIHGEGDKSLVFSDIVHGERTLDITLGTFKYTLEDINYEGIIAVMHDITGRYQLEKSRREFIANVSHELKTPLTSIKGATETILENSDIDQVLREKFLGIIINEADRMTHIVRDLLVLSRLDNNKMQWKFEQVNIGRLCTQIYDAMQVQAADRGHTFTINVREPIPVTCADKERIEQVLVNVLSNAMKYTPNGGEVELEVASGDGAIYIRIRDNGRGIPAEDLPRLFERFYRVEKARSSETGGTGLGLAISKEIVTAHNGTITIESTVGEGTTVTVVLPVNPHSPVSET